MPELLPEVLRHLDALVAFDTRNPPRLIGTGGIFDYLRAQLPGFRVEVSDHGDGAVSMLAVRGNPRRVFNVHLDTVPASEAWSADPHVLRVTHDRAIGLGACDIKGAAAALVAAASVAPGDAAFLFSTDEEANDPRCIAAFLGSDHGFAEAIVAEPTRCEAVLAHRGISSVLMKFRGEAGHASGAQRDDRERVAPGDALGRQCAGPGRGRGQRPLRRADRAALQHRQGRGRDQGEHHRAQRRGPLRLPPVAVAGHRRPARALRHLRCDRRAGTLPGNLPRASAAGWRRGQRRRRDGWPRATSPTNSACRSATRSTSGPRPRCSRRPA